MFVIGGALAAPRKVLGKWPGLAPEQRHEGRDLAPMLRGSTPTNERPLFWRITTQLRQQRAVRLGPWKLLVDGDDIMLFDLTRDVGERHDVAFSQPEVVRRLRPLLAAWEKDVDGEAASHAHPR
jgi:hypothetical protein